MNGSNQGSIGSAWQFAGLGLAMFLGLVIAVVFIARSYVVAPMVGDIVALRPGAMLLDPAREGLQAVRLDSAGKRGPLCRLQTDVMTTGGGSVVVESERGGPRPAYVVHWAGGPTSRDATDCGSSADLELTPNDLARLAQIAGGFGAAAALK